MKIKMTNTKHFYFIAIFMAASILFFASCDLNKEEKAGKPWKGKEVKEMNPGSGMANYGNWIPNAKKGEIYWYYINAYEDMTYSVNMNVPLSRPASFAQYPASAEMTGYKEDGTIFGKMNSQDEGNYLNTPITYYSPINQKLYISFKIIATAAGGGYFVFGYNEN